MQSVKIPLTIDPYRAAAKKLDYEGCIAASDLARLAEMVLSVAGTVMAQDYANGEIKLLNFEEYCEAVAEMIKIIGFETAIERFSGESPSDMLIAPDWCGERDKIIATVEKLLNKAD